MTECNKMRVIKLDPCHREDIVAGKWRPPKTSSSDTSTVAHQYPLVIHVPVGNNYMSVLFRDPVAVPRLPSTHPSIYAPSHLLIKLRASRRGRRPEGGLRSTGADPFFFFSLSSFNLAAVSRLAPCSTGSL